MESNLSAAEKRAGSKVRVPLEDDARAELEAVRLKCQRASDDLYEQLLIQAQAIGRDLALVRASADASGAKVASPTIDHYRSGQSLMHQLGAQRVLDPASSAMALEMRRELMAGDAPPVAQCMVIDMAVTAFSDAMRLQALFGNLCLVIESELFAQPSLRTKWQRSSGRGSEKSPTLEVDEHMQRLSERVVPLIQRLHRLSVHSLRELGRMRTEPSSSVERAAPLRIASLSSANERARVSHGHQRRANALPRGMGSTRR